MFICFRLLYLYIACLIFLYSLSDVYFVYITAFRLWFSTGLVFFPSKFRSKQHVQKKKKEKKRNRISRPREFFYIVHLDVPKLQTLWLLWQDWWLPILLLWVWGVSSYWYFIIWWKTVIRFLKNMISNIGNTGCNAVSWIM